MVEILKMKFNSVLALNRGKIHEVAIENINDLTQVGEYKVAFEILCDILHEDKILISENEYELLYDLGTLLKVDFALLELIKELLN